MLNGNIMPRLYLVDNAVIPSWLDVPIHITYTYTRMLSLTRLHSTSGGQTTFTFILRCDVFLIRYEHKTMLNVISQQLKPCMILS